LSTSAPIKGEDLDEAVLKPFTAITLEQDSFPLANLVLGLSLREPPYR